MAATTPPALSAEAHSILSRVVVADLEQLAEHLESPRGGGSLYMIGDRLRAARELGVTITPQIDPHVAGLRAALEDQGRVIAEALVLVEAVEAAGLSADQFVGVFAPLLSPLNDLADTLGNYR